MTQPPASPTLREGLALGAPEHAGFVAMWNWICGFFRSIREQIPTDVNGRTGRIAIVAGEGIDVVASGSVITVALGTGKSEDRDSAPVADRNGGGAVDDPGTWTEMEAAETDGGTSGGGGSGGMFAWDSATKTIGPGGAMVAREWVEATGTGVADMADGTYWLKVSFGASGASAEVICGSCGARTDTECWIPIYTISEGRISVDSRGAYVVPCWE